MLYRRRSQGTTIAAPMPRKTRPQGRWSHAGDGAEQGRRRQWSFRGGDRRRTSFRRRCNKTVNGRSLLRLTNPERRRRREDRKKRQEEIYLRRFRENFLGFPEGEILPNEHPDFLVETSWGRVGVELTEYHVQESGKSRGSQMRAQEATEDKVLRRADEQYRTKGLPLVAVQVTWHPHEAFGRRRTAELAADLADLVREHLPEPNHSVTIRRLRHPAGWSLPEEVASLYILRWQSISKSSWTPMRAAFVPTIVPPDLQEILRKKEAKVPSYRRHCREVWLLVVARGLEPSTFGGVGQEVEGHQFESGFDRIFLLHHFDGIVTEIHIRRSA
jgi:hypothetical protein